MEAYEALQNAFGHETEMGYPNRSRLFPYIRKDLPMSVRTWNAKRCGFF
jgi:hypothetical protein